MFEVVERMMTDSHAPTAPLPAFLIEYEKDDTLWWRINSGHHLNLFEAAVEKIADLEAQLAEAHEMILWFREHP